jgi:hypothetical protein
MFVFRMRKIKLKLGEIVKLQKHKISQNLAMLWAFDQVTQKVYKIVENVKSRSVKLKFCFVWFLV